MSQPPYHKQVRHFNVFGHVHLLTFSCYHQRPLLTGNMARRGLADAINRAAERLGFGLTAFVFMPEHVHLLVNPLTPECSVERILYGIKKPFSDRLKHLLLKTGSSLLEKLIVQESPGKFVFRFWQAGPGHDRNIYSVKNCIHAAEYLHNNPVRRRLCRSPDEWEWSSWKFYHRPEQYNQTVLPHIAGFPQ